MQAYIVELWLETHMADSFSICHFVYTEGFEHTTELKSANL